MKQIVVLAFICIQIVAFGQKPEEIYSFAKVYKPHSYYVEQAELWWKELEKNMQNENAWYNYFKANRFAKGTFNNAGRFDESLNKGWIKESTYLMEGKDIIKKTNEFIPATFTNHYIQWWNEGSDPQMFEYLQKAFEIDPSHPEMYDGFVVYYETQGNMAKRREFNRYWYRLNDLSQGFLQTGYNLLQSVEQGGVLLTFGDNDTFPLWMLQDVFNIRTDVTVLCVPLLAIDSYRKAKFTELGVPEIEGELESNLEGENKFIDHLFAKKPKNMNVYISMPAWKKLEKYEDKLYITGLVFKYSEESIDNIAIMKNNFENKYLLDYLYHQFNYDISESLVKRANVNYLPALMKLYEHSKLSGDLASADKYKKLGLHIAVEGGDEWKAKAVEIFK